MDNLLVELTNFLEKANFSGYAGGGVKVATERQGHTEHEFKDGAWQFRDSFTGSIKSWGQEVVRYDHKPFWTQLYGGGMEQGFMGDPEFIKETLVFLKKALSRREAIDTFQPRGPKKLKADGWEYYCKWEGSIREFQGIEYIYHRRKLVYTYKFMGGLIINGE